MATALIEALLAEEEKLLACVHCGLCLPTCPTYSVLGDENDSPRGRIYLMRAVAEERLEPKGAYVTYIDRCVICRACETACPSGVPFGSLIEAARSDLALQPPRVGRLQHLFHTVALKYLLPSRFLMKLALLPARILRRMTEGDLSRDGDGSFLDRYPRLKFIAAMIPAPNIETGSRPSPEDVPSSPEMVVAQFVGCVMPEAFSEINDATIRVLKVNGCAVDRPSSQGCCGALHAHTGDVEGAKELARNNIDGFDDGTAAPIIVNAAGCGATLKEYGDLLADDPDYADRAVDFSKRVKDVTEFLVDLGPVIGGPVDATATYDAPCHLHHAQRVQDAPLSLLGSIPELDLRPLRRSEVCCGAGGTYNLTQPELASDILGEKLENIRDTGADVVVTGNPGCHMQILAGVRLEGLELEVRHPVELLDASYEAAGMYGSETS